MGEHSIQNLEKEKVDLIRAIMALPDYSKNENMIIIRDQLRQCIEKIKELAEMIKS